MGRVTEEPIPVEESYRELLREAVRKAGGQSAVERIADIDQATISRTLTSGKRATYTAIMKLKRALAELPSPIVVPSPVVPVRDARHEAWCRGGGELASTMPAVFNMIFDALRQALQTTAPQTSPSVEESQEASGSSRVTTLPKRSPTRRHRVRR